MEGQLLAAQSGAFHAEVVHAHLERNLLLDVISVFLSDLGVISALKAFCVIPRLEFGLFKPCQAGSFLVVYWP